MPPAGDNPGSDPARLFSVAEGQPWGEDEVRRCLADQVAGVQASRTDLAGTAITRGRRVRGRRQLAGLAGLVGATVLATGVLLHDWQGAPGGGGDLGPAIGLIGDPVTPDATPEQPARLESDPALAVDLAVDLIGAGVDGGRVLATGDGRTLRLGPVDDVVSAHRVGEGWAVVSGEAGTVRLWWVGSGQEPVPVLAGMDAIVVEQAQVAWRRGALLAAATLSGEGDLREQSTTAAPEGDGQPVGFAGRTVLLARADPTGWDTWQPARGKYTPSWTGQVTRVYGALPDGQSAIGLVPPEPGAEEPCLAELDPARRLAASTVGCPDTGAGGLSTDGPAALSPHGRWLIATVDGGQRAPVVVVDVTAALAAQPEAVVPVPDLAAPTARPVWLDSDQVLVQTVDSLVRVAPEKLFAGAAGAVEVVGLAGVTLVVVQPV